MPQQSSSNKGAYSIPELVRSLFLRYAAIPSVLLAGVLIVSVLVVTHSSEKKVRETRARYAANSVDSYFTYFLDGLASLGRGSSVATQDEEERRWTLESLVLRLPSIDELSYVDRDGSESVRVSRFAPLSEQPRDWTDNAVFARVVREGTSYVGEFRYNPISREPVMTVAVPVFRNRSGARAGMIVATVRLRILNEALLEIAGSNGETVYITDSSGTIIAHPDPIVVLSETTVPSILNRVERSGIFFDGVAARSVVRIVEAIPFGTENFYAVVERSVLASYWLVALMTLVALVATVVVLVGIGRAHAIATERIVTPTMKLADASTSIGESDSHLVDLPEQSVRELRTLAEAMTRSSEQIAMAFRELEEANIEKATLLREVHHRVKNNLQIIRSLINLEESSHRDLPESTRQVLSGTNARIFAMALVHEQLYGTTELSRIPVGDYLAALVSNLLTSYELPGRRVASRVEVDPLELSLDLAIPLGLVTNELVTNSLRHAFADRQEDVIIVGIRDTGDGNALFFVADDGIGIDPSVYESGTDASLGSLLVTSLVSQLGGTLAVDTKQGCRVEISFPFR
jgi:two-component sensor histidine kinase